VNRVPLVAAGWFIFWTVIGWVAGRLLDTPVTYTIAGFLFAFISIFAWPFIFPDRFQDWMYD